MIWIYIADVPDSKIGYMPSGIEKILFQTHHISFGELMRDGLILSPNREWTVETIGL